MGSGKHLVDADTKTLVLNSLRGLCRSNPTLILDPTHRTVYRKPSSKRVHLISGGGSGHEPTHAGFVGSNMLDCAVSGDVFASPSSSAVTAGIKNLGDNPVLVIVKNYTGDRLHFGMAIENAHRSGHKAEMVVVADDVSVGKKQGGRVGRRGLAGVVLVHKIAGGAARASKSLEEVKAQALAVVDNLVTVGASLTHASVPGSLGDEITLGADEIEIGMGIHNEPGFEKIKTPSVTELANILLKQLLDQEDEDRAFVSFKKGDEVVLLINNLGAISNLELYHLTQIVSAQLNSDWGLEILRTYTGAYTTSLDGAGASVTLLNLSNLANKEEVIHYLDLPSDAPGWNSSAGSGSWAQSSQEVATKIDVKPKSAIELPLDPSFAQKLINGACQSLIAAESDITKYDTIAGDGDAGLTLKSASQAVQAALAAGKISTSNAIDLFGDIATLLEDNMGGTGGALYTIYFAALSAALAAATPATLNAKVMSAAISTALERLCTYTTATIGDKTMMDSLIPFAKTFSDTADFRRAVDAAREGAESTKGMNAGLGRATYVDTSAASTVPDAGAIGVWKLLEGVRDQI